MLRRRLSTLSNVDCIPVVCFSIFDHTQRACLSALLRIPEILFFSRFSTFSCSSVAIWLMKRDSSSVPMGLCPILLPILLQSYIYFRERRTNKAAERERERDAVWVGKIESESKTESAAKKDGRINEQAKRRRQRQQHSNGHKNMCAVNEFLYFVAFGSILISHTHTHICTHMHVGGMGCCRRVCEREGHRLRTGEKKRNHVPRRLLPPLLLLLCPPSRMAYIFIYNFSFHFICAFSSPPSLWLIFGTALFLAFQK